MNHRRDEHGAALPMALCLMVVVGALTAAIASGSRRLADDTVRRRAAAVVRQAADAGIERARWALVRDGGYRGERLMLGDAEVEIVAESSPQGWSVVACGSAWPRGRGAPPHRVAVRARLVREADGTLGVRDWRTDAR